MKFFQKLPSKTYTSSQIPKLFVTLNAADFNYNDVIQVSQPRQTVMLGRQAGKTFITAQKIVSAKYKIK